MTVPFRILEQIAPETREQLLASHRRIELPAGHQLIFQADWGSEVYVVESGLAKARCLSLQGDEVVLTLMGSGALIGDLALLSPKPVRTVDVVALTAMSVMKLRQGALEETLQNSPRFSQAITYLQVQRLCNLGNRLMIMNEDATTRLLYALQQLAIVNSPDGDPCHPMPSLAQQEIASIAGLSRGSTSTLINKLRSNGTLEQTEQGLRFATLAPLQRRGLLPEPASSQARA
jgi:CRP/FNR family cyclic AMP-dependent transcriptional regulator